MNTDDLAYFDRHFAAVNGRLDSITCNCMKRTEECGKRFAKLEGNNKVLKALEEKRTEKENLDVETRPLWQKVRSNWALVAVTIFIMLNAVIEVIRWTK